MREFGSEHSTITLPDGYFENLNNFGRKITYLRSGREALLYVACNCKLDERGVILLPSYCCWSMSAPFAKSGWNISYYKLKEDLTIDEEYLIKLLNNCKVDAILTMNFFGSASTDNAIRLVKEFWSNIIVIEDFSHCTFSIKKIFNPAIDYYVSSIRKSIGVCDGAVVLSKEVMNSAYMGKEIKDFSDRRAIAQKMKSQYTYTKDQDIKKSFLSEIKFCEGLIDEFDLPRPISVKARNMLHLVNGGNIAFARRENMKHLISLLGGKVKMLPGLERCLDGAPFSLPILVENRDDVQYRLSKSGVYAPVLWPISDDARQICSVSACMADHMLSIPIDQRYDWDDIEEIARIVLSCV